MVSFFEKLKKGMGVEEEIEPILETSEDKPASAKAQARREKPKKRTRKVKNSQSKKVEIKTEPVEPEPERIEKPIEKPETPETKPVSAKASASDKSSADKPAGKEKWFEPEGELAVDVYQTDKEIVIQSAIAGVKPEDLDISIERDVVLIKGERKPPLKEESNYFYQECYWGPFFREIILPEETDPSRVTAGMKEGILIIRIPKIERKKKRKITIKG